MVAPKFHKLYASIGVSPNHLASAIGRAVVRNAKFEILECLRQYGFDGLTDELCVIERSHYDRYSRVVSDSGLFRFDDQVVEIRPRLSTAQLGDVAFTDGLAVDVTKACLIKQQFQFFPVVDKRVPPFTQSGIEMLARRVSEEADAGPSVQPTRQEVSGNGEEIGRGYADMPGGFENAVAFAQ